MKKTLAVSLLLAGMIGAMTAHATDTRARFIAANCSYCHGPDGKSRGAVPGLAGMEKDYFISQMKAFRDGSRDSTVMAKHANGYSDEEFERMAKWFAEHK